MAPLAAEAWVAIGGVAGLAVLVTLHTLAALVRDEREVRELHRRAERIRREFAKQLNAEVGEIIVVDEAPPPG